MLNNIHNELEFPLTAIKTCDLTWFDGSVCLTRCLSISLRVQLFSKSDLTGQLMVSNLMPGGFSAEINCLNPENQAKYSMFWQLFKGNMIFAVLKHNHGC